MGINTNQQISSEAAVDGQPAVLTMIDDALVALAGRSLVSGHDVVDILLELRSNLAMEMRLDRLRVPVPT